MCIQFEEMSWRKKEKRNGYILLYFYWVAARCSCFLRLNDCSLCAQRFIQCQRKPDVYCYDQMRSPNSGAQRAKICKFGKNGRPSQSMVVLRPDSVSLIVMFNNVLLIHSFYKSTSLRKFWKIKIYASEHKNSFPKIAV